jgi:NAD(P)-dependent dehydrogenase (short-subunit alcohol dehydrogenase family)
MPIGKVPPEEWRRVIESDVIGYFNLLHVAIPALRRTRGSIVELTTAGTRRYPARDILSAGPKAAVELLTRDIAREEGRNGIRANCVGVGWIDAGQGSEMKQIDRQTSFMDRFVKAKPLGRLGTAEEVADAARFFASDQATYVSGNLVFVDGGGHV